MIDYFFIIFFIENTQSKTFIKFANIKIELKI